MRIKEKKRMRAIMFLVILAFCVMILPMVTMAQDAEPTVLTWQSSVQQAKTGESFTVTLSCPTKLSTFDVHIQYDAAVLTPQAVSSGVPDQDRLVSNLEESGMVYVNYTDITKNGVQLTDNVLVTVTFAVKEGAASGLTKITPEVVTLTCLDGDYEHRDIEHTIDNQISDGVEILSGGLKGDANCDGEVNIKDANAIQLHLVSLIQLSDQGLYNAKVFDGSTLSIKDANRIQLYLVRSISEL